MNQEQNKNQQEYLKSIDLKIRTLVDEAPKGMRVRTCTAILESIADCLNIEFQGITDRLIEVLEDAII